MLETTLRILKNIRNSFFIFFTLFIFNNSIAKEITKIHEEFIRAKIKDIKLFKIPLKGELTLVVSSNETKVKVINATNKEKIINKAKKYLKKYSLKDTVDLIIETENINRKEIYQLCLNIKNENNS